jgi:phosphoribosylformimino-5-aminoimidazole carboxamide ribotide isomerase
MDMRLIPAIDLLDGRCVRLLHGDFNQVTEYSASAEDLASQYADAGAQWLHVVDLAASRDGADADSFALFKFLNVARQSVQTGGGVRRQVDIGKRLDAGAARVVIGSLCATDTRGFCSWLEQFGSDKLVAALDVRIDEDGIPWPRIHGWTDRADRNMWQLLDELSASGLKHLLCTDISRDGALSGPNLELYSTIMKRYPQLKLQASGGVSSLEDIEQLKATGASGVITGKALLDKRFTVSEALEALR